MASPGHLHHPPPAKRKKANSPRPAYRRWTDLARFALPEGSMSSPLFSLPVEVLDRILATSDFTLADHLALSGTCRAFRKAYSGDVMYALIGRYSEPDGIIDEPLRTTKIASSMDDHDSRSFQLPTLRKEMQRMAPGPMLGKTRAKKEWRVTDSELLLIPVSGHERRPTYQTAAVRRLAYRSHGGPIGHYWHVHRLDAAKERSGKTRIQNGTKQAAYAKGGYYDGACAISAADEQNVTRTPLDAT